MRPWEPPVEQVIEPPKPKRWPLVVLLLAVLGVAAAGLWMIRDRQLAALHADVLPRVTEVRSELTTTAESLEVVVRWRMPDARSGVVPDSVRVEVGLGDGRQSQTKVSPNDRTSDTLHLPQPGAGQSAEGYSCVATVEAARLSRETCTPWQYVRPAAQVAPAGLTPDSAHLGHGPRRAAEAAIARIVVMPDGQQVDPDLRGRCAAWQRGHPDGPVWVEVNRQAVPECTGPNGKPTVAKFCAFAVLADGRRVKTAASINDAYCEGLFQDWVREQVA
jgi:hypothetical protein